jgi:predicted dehydrogenase
MRLLVVGGGSIGKRHLANFKQLGVSDLAVVDLRADRRQEVADKLGVSRSYADVDSALREGVDAVVVGTPTAYHTSIALRAIEHGAHVLIEKPISDREDGLDRLIDAARRGDRVLLVGYTYRFWPPLLKLHEILESRVLGRVYFSDVTFSEYLPDWHPWEDYRAWFMSKKDQGGGAMLDESHAVDMARWLFGEIEEVFCSTGNISHLEMTADDYAHFLVGYASGAKGTIHMDLFGRRHRRSIEITAEKGNISWDFFQNRLEVRQVDRPDVESLTFTCDRNDMFLAEARHFLNCIGGSERPVVTGEDAVATLRVLLAGIRSSQTGQRVAIR